MDTSETYIKMCDCPEIQALKPYSDKYYCELREGINRFGDFVSFQNGAKDIWLPRQDQLQKMVGCSDIQVALHRLYQIAEFWIGTDVCSYEQLWLAFVMKENHGKMWSAVGWIDTQVPSEAR